MKTFEKISVRCHLLGISISELCRRSEIERRTIDNWKNEEPKTLVIYDRLLTELTKLEYEYNTAKTISIEKRKRHKREL